MKGFFDDGYGRMSIDNLRSPLGEINVIKWNSYGEIKMAIDSY